MEKISITRALSEIKLLEKKITKKINEFKPTSVTIGKKAPLGFATVKEFKDSNKAEYQSILDLIKRRSEIKRKIVLSNAKTEVTVAGLTFTIAECIDYKTSIVGFKNSLCSKIINEYNHNAQIFANEETRVRQNVDRQLEAVFGRDKKVTKEEIDTISKPYLENNGPVFVDSINCKKESEKLSEWSNTFLLEVDHILSESNATTFIEIG